jgi:hypothetical protein
VHSAALAPARRLLLDRSSPLAPSLALRWQREPPSAGEGANLYGRRWGLGGLSWAHPGASPSIGPWGIPSAAPSRLPSTNARFGDLVGHPRRCTSCGEARSRHGGPSVSQPFYSYSPKFILESTAKGPTPSGAYRRVHSAALAPARRLVPGRSSPFAPSLALRWQRAALGHIYQPFKKATARPLGSTF